MPTANRLTVGILAMVADEERRMISKRTKEALAAAKVRGVKLGGNRGSIISAEAREVSRQSRQAASEARAADLAPVISELQAAGVASLGGLARGLSERGIPIARAGTKWTLVQVSRVLARLAATRLFHAAPRPARRSQIHRPRSWPPVRCHAPGGGRSPVPSTWTRSCRACWKRQRCPARYRTGRCAGSAPDRTARSLRAPSA